MRQKHIVTSGLDAPPAQTLPLLPDQHKGVFLQPIVRHSGIWQDWFERTRCYLITDAVAGQREPTYTFGRNSFCFEQLFFEQCDVHDWKQPGGLIIKNSVDSFNYSYLRDIVGYLAYFVFAKTTNLATAHFSKIELTTKEGMILEFIANNPGASQIDIARKAGMKAPLLVKILDDLSNRNLLLRELSPIDRRRHHLRLTEAGEALRDPIRACHLAGNDELFDGAGFSAEEAETLLKLLRKLTDHIQTL